MKHIRQGNTINLRYTLYRVNGENKVPEDLTGTELRATLKNIYFGMKFDPAFEISGNTVSVVIPGQPLLKTGVYNLALYYNKNGQDYAIDTDAFEIVDRSSKVEGVTCCPDMEIETVNLAGDIGYNTAPDAVEQIQSDWNETNSVSKAFIKNKPEIPVLPEGIVVDPDYVHTDAVSVENISVNPADDYILNASLKPNIFYSLSMVKQLTLELLPPTNTNLYNEYMFMFVSGETPTTLILPSGIKWMNEPTIETNHTYQVSIAFGIAVIGGVSNG